MSSQIPCNPRAIGSTPTSSTARASDHRHLTDVDGQGHPRTTPSAINREWTGGPVKTSARVLGLDGAALDSKISAQPEKAPSLAPVAATRDALLHALALAERARPTAEVQALRASTWGPGWMDVLGLSTPLAAQWTASRARAVAGIVASLAALDEAERRGELVGRHLGRRVYALVASALVRERVLVVTRYGLRWSPDLLGGEQRRGVPVGLEPVRQAVLTAIHGRRPVLPLPLPLRAA